MSLKKKIFVTLGILVMLPILYVAIKLSGQYFTTRAAIGKVTAARSAAEKVDDKVFRDMSDLLFREGIATARLGSSKVDICYIDHNDAGWFAMNWYQRCYLRYVEGLAVNLDRATLKQKLASLPEVKSLFGEISTLPDTYPYPRECQLYKKQYSTTMIFLPAGHTTFDPDGTCTIPAQINRESYPSLGPPVGVKRYRTFSETSVANSQHQIWLTHQKEYYREDLGCGVGLFCESPRSKPVQP